MFLPAVFSEHGPACSRAPRSYREAHRSPLEHVTGPASRTEQGAVLWVPGGDGVVQEPGRGDGCIM